MDQSGKIMWRILITCSIVATATNILLLQMHWWVPELILWTKVIQKGWVSHDGDISHEYVSLFLGTLSPTYHREYFFH